MITFEWSGSANQNAQAYTAAHVDFQDDEGPQMVHSRFSIIVFNICSDHSFQIKNWFSRFQMKSIALRK
jgi:hypothetical protein